MSDNSTPGEHSNAQAAVQMLFSVLSPNVIADAEKLRNGQSRLVHYTSAENALSIIKSEQFWLRNVRCMNDYSEIQHGLSLLLKIFGEDENARLARLVAAFDRVAEGAAQAAIENFNNWIPVLPDQTFIGCLSQFDPSDSYGRLSMWRAYAAPNVGVAIVMNSDPFLAETDALSAYSLPVAYLTDVEFAAGIDRCLEALEANLQIIQPFNAAAIQHFVFWWLLSLAVGLKHPAFVEEREWRIIYIPSMWKSEVIEESVECIGGIPQIVQRLPLRDDPANGLINADINSLVHKLLIGPSEFPIVLREAFARALSQKNVTNASDRVEISFIPLR